MDKQIYLGHMTGREYSKRQCDKCVDYIPCDILEGWLEYFRTKIGMHSIYITSGCDLAKICWEFKPENQ